jgi:hypothetical protein
LRSDCRFGVNCFIGLVLAWRAFFTRLTLMLKIFLAPAAVAFSLAGMIAQPVHADGFTCIDREEWKELEITRNGVTLNNFSLRSIEMSLPGAPLSAYLSYSITNRSQQTAHVTAQFVFMDNAGEPLLALSAPHVNYPVQPGETITADTSTFIEDSLFERLGGTCYRVQGARL